MSATLAPWIRELWIKQQSDNAKREATQALESKAELIIKSKGPDYWTELCKEINSQGKQCKLLKVAIKSKKEPDPRGEDAECLVVRAIAITAAAREAQIRLSYKNGDRVIILYRTPPYLPFGEQVVNIRLAALESGGIVGYYFEEGVYPPKLAEYLLKFLTASLDESQIIEIDDQVSID